MSGYCGPPFGFVEEVETKREASPLSLALAPVSARMARKPLYPLLPDTLGLSSDDEDYTLGNGDDAPAAAHPGSLAGAGSSDCNHRSSRGQNKVHENSTAASGSGTLSLADFEKKYLNSRSRPRPSHSSRPSPAARRGVTGASVDTLAGLQNGLQWGYQWLAGASRWKIVFVGSVLGVLLAMLLGSGSGGARLRDGLQGDVPTYVTSLSWHV